MRINDEIQENLAVTARLADSVERIAEAADMIGGVLTRGGKVITIGNGGSAADAQHLAAELVGRYRINRPALAAVALTTDSSALTAIANDYGFEQVFSRQLEALARPGDAVVAFSTSGNSINVLRALEGAKKLKVTSVGLSGRSGGKMAELVDICLRVPSDSTPRIQEAHTLISHILCGIVEARFSADAHAGLVAPSTEAFLP
jgi:D-sedoheptulose 7-phosphate isomerase